MKKAYLWVIIEKNIPIWPKRGPYNLPDISGKPDYVIPIRIAADYCFSSKEKFTEVLGWNWKDHEDANDWQLVEIQVPDEFDDWDYIAENY